MRKLEERFAQELVVVGVHSAKFPAEGDSSNLRAAVIRHDLRHPVVNDREFLLWRAYAVRAWPTLMIVSPEGRVVAYHAGEFDADALGNVLAEIIAEYDNQGLIRRELVSVALERQRLPEQLLSFPGKVLADPVGDRLFVADTDHHRVLVCRLSDGRVLEAVGDGCPGWNDGPFGLARFRGPQGMALVGDRLFLADTENHVLRTLDLDRGVVTTLAGTGEQAAGSLTEAAAATRGGLPGRELALNSPWALSAHEELLYVAMAGSHQIWTVRRSDGQVRLFAGDGREALQDGPRLRARLAQPSGLTSDGERLWFVDSETSSLRSVPFPARGSAGEEKVTTHLGQGLFDFGDVDGDRETARLQHPLDVAWLNGRLYLADSYNHRIKVFDPETGRVASLAGVGEGDSDDGEFPHAGFWEPGGVSAAGEQLYVADTNNHAIRVLDLTGRIVRTLRLWE